MELHNFSRRPGKFFLGFLEKCTDGEWLGIKLHNPQLTHQDAFSSILESVIYYIQERFKGSEVTIAFNVLYPADWPREIRYLSSYGEEEIEISVKRLERVLPSECSLVKVLEE